MDALAGALIEEVEHALGGVVPVLGERLLADVGNGIPGLPVLADEVLRALRVARAVPVEDLVERPVTGIAVPERARPGGFVATPVGVAGWLLLARRFRVLVGHGREGAHRHLDVLVGPAVESQPAERAPRAPAEVAARRAAQGVSLLGPHELACPGIPHGGGGRRGAVDPPRQDPEDLPVAPVLGHLVEVAERLPVRLPERERARRLEERRTDVGRVHEIELLEDDEGAEVVEREERLERRRERARALARRALHGRGQVVEPLVDPRLARELALPEDDRALSLERHALHHL